MMLAAFASVSAAPVELAGEGNGINEGGGRQEGKGGEQRAGEEEGEEK